MQNNIVVIFSRSPVLGKVKTRLAKEVGNIKAFEIHNKLFKLTGNITNSIDFDREYYLSEEILKVPVENYKLQQGNDLGERMLNAITDELKVAQKVCVIGIDCPDLTSNDISMAFEQLNNYDVVLGPASDGGYYLIGMKIINYQLFSNISWGTGLVLEETLNACSASGLSATLLRKLTDVDETKDIPLGWL